MSSSATIVDDLPSFPRPMFALGDINARTRQAPVGLAILGLTFGAAGLLGSPSPFHVTLALNGAAFLGAAYAMFVWLNYPRLNWVKARAFTAWYGACAFAWATLFSDVAVRAGMHSGGWNAAHVALGAFLGLELVYTGWATTLWGRAWRRHATRTETSGR